MSLLRLPTPSELNPVRRTREATAWLKGATGRRHRRATVSRDGHAHIEVRGVHGPAWSALLSEVRSALERLEGVDWAEVDAIVGRVVIVFDPEALSADDLIATIETVEDVHGARDERFPHDRPDHPADREPIQRSVFAIVADVAGLGFATAAQTLRFVPIPAEIPGLISLVDSQPRVRRFLENRFGRPVADFTLAGANALAQAVGQGPLGLLVDIAHRTSSVSELQARRAVWDAREPKLVTSRKSVREDALDLEPRPAPLPAGPIERYSDRAAIASLGAFAIALGVSRNPRRSADLLLTSIPKAASMGRDAFAAQFDRALASNGVIAMDQRALRRLDRVDTLVIEARIAVSGTWAIDDITPFDSDADPLECTLRGRQLFDPSNPTRVRARGAWLLAPLDSSEYPLPRGAKNRARLAGQGGRRVVGLWHGDRLRALVAAIEEPVPLTSELIKVARDNGLEVMLAGGAEAFARRLGEVGRLVEGRLTEELRALQGSGHVVMLVAGHDHVALHAADVGLGVEVSGTRMPWGAHLMVGPDLANAWRIVDAVQVARDVSRRSALFAFAGASTGGIWSFVGPGRSAAQRALMPINGAAMLSIAMGGIAGVQAGSRRPPRPAPDGPWHELEPAAVLDRFESSSTGLSSEEQRRRRAISTAHRVHAPIGLVRAAVDELANPLTPLLGVGAALSAAAGSVTDAVLVIGVTGINALVGAAQRVQTERALVRLEDVGDRPVSVRVSGALRALRSDSLVVGDVIELGAADVVPADCRLLEAVSLEVDESAITGESFAVAKSVEPAPGAPMAERSSMIYEGTNIAAGGAVALVVAVGADTEAGRSAAMAADPPPSGVEQRLSHLTRLALPVTVVGGAAVTGLGFLYRRPARTAVGSGVALMVAAVPEGLPALATIAQVAAARRLASRGALVRNPRAIEALGRVDQICFDKTGTLTEGSISLVCVSDGVEEESLLALSERGRSILAAALRATPAGDSDDVLPHATDYAIVAGAAAAGIGATHGSAGWERLEEIPFESGRGYHAVLGHVRGIGNFVTVKGAPEIVLPLATTWRRGDAVVTLDAQAHRAIEDEVKRLGRRGLRVLAVAEATSPNGSFLADGSDMARLQLLGFVALSDLVRPTAAASVARLRSAGVRVAMVTGDHPSTAEAIAVELGLLNGGKVLTGADLDQLSDAELASAIADVAVFARVAPVHKVRIVDAYQRTGHAVAMTGDGANDAGAIRLADAGIALGGRANAAARQTADLIVLDDRIETIVDAIVEGRAMWQSVQEAVAILVGGNLGEIGFTLFGAALTGTAPLNPRQLMLVNLLTDMAPALAIALREPPDRTPERLLHSGPDASLGRALTTQIALRAAATAAGATTAWSLARVTGTPTRARTVGLAALVGTQLGQTLVAGGRSPLVLGATALSVGALVATIQTPGISQFFGCRPLGPVGWTIAIGSAAGATGASVVLPWTVRRVGARLISRTNGITFALPDAPARREIRTTGATAS
jgi:cation-transporting P-type ATPase I